MREKLRKHRKEMEPSAELDFTLTVLSLLVRETRSYCLLRTLPLYDPLVENPKPQAPHASHPLESEEGWPASSALLTARNDPNVTTSSLHCLYCSMPTALTGLSLFVTFWSSCHTQFDALGVYLYANAGT